MEKIYIVEVIEPTTQLRKFKNQKNWKQLCNFSIEYIKIDTDKDEKGTKKQKN